MNVVMPTATSSMHTDPALSAASSKTAERGLKVLKSLHDDSDTTKNDCKAIYNAAMVELGGEESKEDNVDAERIKVSIKYSRHCEETSLTHYFF